MTEPLGLPGNYRVGCVLAVPVKTEVGVVSHKGIMTERQGSDGLPTVVHNAKLFGKIVENSMTDFALLSIGPIACEGYPGLFSPEEVLLRARSQIEKPWRPWNNCEHFAAWAHGLPAKSPQIRSGLKKAAAGAGLGAALLLLVKLRA